VLPEFKVEEHVKGIKTDENGEKTIVENFFSSTYVPTMARTA
jgi:hypothetical protein